MTGQQTNNSCVLLKPSVTLASRGGCLVTRPLKFHDEEGSNRYRLSDLDEGVGGRSPLQRQTNLLEWFVDEAGTSESPVNLDRLDLQLHLIQRLTGQRGIKAQGWAVKCDTSVFFSVTFSIPTCVGGR